MSEFDEKLPYLDDITPDFTHKSTKAVPHDTENEDNSITRPPVGASHASHASYNIDHNKPVKCPDCDYWVEPFFMGIHAKSFGHGKQLPKLEIR